MPKGVYKRKPGLKRNISEEAREKFRKNLAKARKSITDCEISETVLNARKKNAATAGKVKSARSILKNLPLCATSGTVFTTGKTRTFTVVDPVPIPSPDGEHWEQKFVQGGYALVYGVKHEFTGNIKIIWDYKPTMENILDKPLLVEE